MNKFYRNLKLFLLVQFLLLIIDVFPQELKFDKLIVEDGLTSINSILIDDNGFTWFGGTHGLFRYDGDKFKAFNHNPSDNFSLSSDNVISLFQDSKGNIWIGTQKNGVNIYDPKSERIQRVYFNDRTISESSISTIVEDSNKNIWIGTLENGLYVVDTVYKVLNHYYQDNKKPNSLSNNAVFDILIDFKNQLWVTTNSGKLDLFEKHGFKHYEYSDQKLSGVRTGQKMVEDKQNRIWLGTEGEGLYIFDQQQEKFTSYHAQHDNSPIKNDVITDLGKDSEGNIWITTDGGGVSYYASSTKGFSHFRFEENNEFGLSNNASYSLALDRNDRAWLGMGDGTVNISNPTIFKFIRPKNGLSSRVVVDLLLDDKENLWVGTGGGGLDQVNIKTNSFKNFKKNKKASGLSSDVILTILEDHLGNIWTGSFLGGINKINKSNKEIEWFTQEEGLSNDHVFDLVEDHNRHLWIATQGGGLNRYDPTTRTFKYFTSHNGSGLLTDRIQSLLIDSKERLWIGLYSGGIQVLDIETESFVNTIIPNVLKSNLSKYPIHSINEDKNQNIWVGTGGLGLIKIDNKSNVEIYDKNKGLPSNSIYGSIVKDGLVWLSTNKGISSIDQASKNIAIFDKSDGLLTSDFESGAVAAAGDGQLFFGSKEGVIHFYPNDLKEEKEEIEIVFTELLVFNEKVIPENKYDNIQILTESITLNQKVKLPYTHNNFTISFSSPSFSKPEKIQYRYKLIGLQDKWILAESERRFVPYSNLLEGKYTFMVQGSLDGNNWSDVKEVIIDVIPPFYRSWYAYLIYFIVLVGVIVLVYRIIRFRISLTNQLKFEKHDREKDNELNKTKINFFTGISHELRTPLTLILGPLEQLVNNRYIDNRMRNQILMMQKNANRLLLLINQLLDFRKMESGKMRLQVSQQDLVYFIEEILLTFRELALQKELQLIFDNKLKSRSFYFDESKLEIILYNLLSNAIKYTGQGGKVIVRVFGKKDKIHHWFLIEVKDNGRGIKPENQDKIFEPFFRGRKIDKDEKGTGIGLSMVKNVVNLHHGKIEMESTLDLGTTFKVALPAEASSYDPSEMITNTVSANNSILDDNEIYKPIESINDASKLPKLLIVEDNKDIMGFLKDGFILNHEVFVAEDGKEGREKAFELIPDIIISDIMMPVMDGIEMCRHLKSDIRTSHVPIILLTARSGFTHELSGLNTGADDYVTKPFQIELLSARAHNLVENRRNLREKFRKDMIMEPNKIAVSDPDEKFLSELMGIIEENISNSEYMVKNLAKDIGLSHSVLYRKIHALTDLSINDFIKTIRLKRATQLLTTNAYSISHVGYMVGFSNPKYFSTCFKAAFNCSPSEFIKSHQDS